MSSAAFSFPPQYQPPGFNSRSDPHRFLGKTEQLGGKNFPSLQFSSRSRVPTEADFQDRISEILYYIDEPDNNHYVLRRADHPYPNFGQPRSNQDPVLCEKIKFISLNYYDNDGKKYDRWDSDSREFDHATPAAVEVRIDIESTDSARIYETKILIPSCRKKSVR
ncbi:MAG: type II secretion system protein GspJ [Thermodesulfobacteriota bacterium]